MDDIARVRQAIGLLKYPWEPRLILSTIERTRRLARLWRERDMPTSAYPGAVTFAWLIKLIEEE